jgi:hypothetical protein
MEVASRIVTTGWDRREADALVKGYIITVR